MLDFARDLNAVEWLGFTTHAIHSSHEPEDRVAIYDSDGQLVIAIDLEDFQ